MRTVRAKLLFVVFACLVPAVVAAVLRAREARADLLGDVQARVKRADDGFTAELDEDLANDALALTLATHDARVAPSLSSGDLQGVRALVKELAGIYTDTLILALDARGRVVAASDPSRAPRSLSPAVTPRLSALFQGQALSGLLPLTVGGKPGYSMVAAQPVTDAQGQVLGALALVTPVDPDYLEHVEKKLGTDLALKVNDALVAACPGHPDPMLEAHDGGVVVRRQAGRLFALSTFMPPSLQAKGQLVEITASEDVTALRDEARRDLLHALLTLAAVLLVAIALALTLAQRMIGAVLKIEAAAAKVRGGEYAEVEGVHTGDELERLARDFNGMVAGLRERDRLKETFGKYVTRQVADRILNGQVKLGGETLPVTVLFSDIRSFTSISEQMEPTALLDFLNVYFSGMVESVMKHDGVVDKFIGDAIMAVFGAPVPKPEDPLNAVKAALEMRARLVEMNAQFRARGLPELKTGIGLHTGEVVAGNMGHVERMEYTVIGDTVNLASRLESLTKELGADVLLSETSYRAVEAHVDAEPLREIQVKGRVQPVKVYRLVGLKAVRAEVA